MPNGKVYDPLIGQWMSPLWENVIERVSTPTLLHLYRFNGNDPINLGINRNRPSSKFVAIHFVSFYCVIHKLKVPGMIGMKMAVISWQ